MRGRLWGLHQVHCAAQIVLRMRVRPHSQAQGEKLLPGVGRTPPPFWRFWRFWRVLPFSVSLQEYSSE